ETTALTLPVVLKAPDVAQPASIAVPIVVGRGNPFIAKLVEKGAIDLKPLKPGQGLLTVVPSPLGGPDGIAIAGGDDEGTLNAAARRGEVWAGGSKAGEATGRRSGLNPRPLTPPDDELGRGAAVAVAPAPAAATGPAGARGATGGGAGGARGARGAGAAAGTA